MDLDKLYLMTGQIYTKLKLSVPLPRIHTYFVIMFFILRLSITNKDMVGSGATSKRYRVVSETDVLEDIFKIQQKQEGQR